MHWRLGRCDEKFLIKQTKFSSKHTCAYMHICIYMQTQHSINSKTQSAKSNSKQMLAKKQTQYSPVNTTKESIREKFQSRPIKNSCVGPCSLCFVMVQNPGHSQLFHYCQNGANFNVAIWEEPIFFTWQRKPLFTLNSPVF